MIPRPFIIPSLLLAAFVTALFAPRADAHPLSTNLYLTILLEEDQMIYEAESATFQFPPLADLKFDIPDLPGVEDRREAIEKFMHEKCTVTIDGIDVPPILTALEFERYEDADHLGDTIPLLYASFKCTYPLKRKPKQIGMKWGYFVEPDADYVERAKEAEFFDPSHNIQELIADIKVYGEYDIVNFTPEEPEYIWHAPIDPATTEANLSNLSSVKPPAGRTLPLAPFAIALFTIGGLLMTKGGKIPAPARGALLVVGIAAAIFARNAMPISIGKSETETPDVAKATDIFKALHANIYNAFDYSDESQIYDVLAQSVDGQMLDQVYNDVYQSLILRDEGGVTCKVQKVDVLACAASPNDTIADVPVFDVDCQWRVHGFVSHHKHTHRRVNEYSARYQMAPIDGKWKIAGVKVDEQKRVTAGEPKEPLIPALPE